MREDILNELEAEYALRRAENERTEAARAAIIREKYPDIQQLREQRQSLVRSGIQFLGAGPSNREFSLTEQVEELNRKIRDALRLSGLPEDYLAPVFSCPRCRDTGYAGELIKEPCVCLKEAYQKKLAQKIGLSGSCTETFETFNTEMIPDQAEEGRKYTQRQLSCRSRDFCEYWADHYPENKVHTLVLSGKSGLGKTFLMHATAARLMERGFSVLIISAFQFLQTARKSYFENNDEMDELINAPVLMLDDVGSEPLMKNITVESLFNLINERQIRGLSTVLSTNLTMQEFTERYTERISSRISDPNRCAVMTLEGKDLRKAGGAHE